MTSETLRDHFSAAALTGFASQLRSNYGSVLTLTAKQCYELADAMLRERERTSVGVAGMDPVADRKSAATPGACASPCSQPFDSAPITHDAAPAARADSPDERPPHAVSAGGNSSAASRDGSGTGDTQKPVAWAVCTPGDGDWSPCFFREPHAQRYANAIFGSKNIVPLYRQPTLTDAEREAIDRARRAFRDMDHNSMTMQQVEDYEALCGLLERMGGGA